MSLFCKPKPKVVRLFLRISPRDLGNEHAPRMTVAAVSAPTAASTVSDSESSGRVRICLWAVMGQESGTGIWLAPFLNLIPGS